jgi:uncharacterized protein DUF87
MKFTIGQTDNKPVKVDAFTLADTRGLICASSGAGKSWLLRLICERVADSIQTIILDPEGEFPTLREKLDLLIVSETGDLRADVRSAGLLARKLAETGVSAVIDIYDLPGKGDPWDKRRAFLAEFITALMNLPKKSYHPMLVIIDEAHNFAPEDARGENAMHARSAIRSLMSAGRKRGFGGILATQRISKIDKDSIADARNVFIGGTTLDIDQKRAGDILGMNKAEYTSLRDLGPGEFYSFGPAVEGKGITRFTSGKVETTHPKAGQRSSIVVPKASTQIETIAKQFGDLPAIAEEEVKSLDSLKRENVDLRRQLRARPTQTETKVETKIERVEVPIITDAQMQSLAERLTDVQGIADELSEWRAELTQLLNGKIETLQSTAFQLSAAITDARKPSKPVSVVTPAAPRSVSRQIVQPARQPVGKPSAVQVEGITNPMQRILDAIAWLESIGIENPKQVAVAFLANYSYGGGAYNNPRGALRSAGLVEYVGDSIRLTEEGRQVANFPDVPLTAEELQRHVMSVLPGPHQKILKVLLDRYPSPISKDECASLAGYAPGGAFNNPMGRLRSMGLVDYPQPGYVVAESLLFLE